MFMAREAATFPSLQWLTKALQALRNYAGCLFAQHEAENSGCHQVLWLYGEDHQITEAGTMNIFLHWINEDGEEELATPCLDGMILPGVTRQSVLELARKWGELKVTERHLTMIQLCSALKQQQVRDVRLWYCQILFQGEGSSYLSITPMVDNGTPSFKAADLVVQLTSTPKNNSEVLPFGMGFTDHMLTIEWSAAEGWQAPHIKPFGNLPLHPACSSLHYGIQLFEGLKVFRGDDDRLRIFRPMLNMKRMSNSAKRVCLPAFDQSELLECIRRLVEIDHEWVPHTDSTSLYIRPTFISTEPSLGVRNPSHALLYVIMSQGSSYFSAESLNLWADPKYTRAWKGGTGDCKLGGNYAGCLFAQHEAENSGCHQVLWLYGEDHQITEAGTMNIFLHWINEDGEEELATPCLDGMILPGVTRQSVLELARKWGELKVTERHLTMIQLCSALKQQRVKEMFGCGTAMMMRPIGQILFQGENIHIPCPDKDSQLTSRLLKELADIQNGRTPSDWTVLV